ncbi:unnamed protein product [Cyclocybe aegerita]|uniref:DNA polymerase lambda n=1 Tax=Cyclocybe aegerita TaxID=1973307 RepID=A0A8S0WH30_CYCAE|nr:unnamed protein product [Cyclocybe aegerita]
MMRDIDLKAFFAEQDERMTLPDESHEEFLERMASFTRQNQVFHVLSPRMPSDASSMSAHNPDTTLDRPTSSFVSIDRGEVLDEWKTIFGCSGDVRTAKRKASDQELVPTAGKRKKVADQVQDSHQDVSNLVPDDPTANASIIPHQVYDTSMARSDLQEISCIQQPSPGTEVKPNKRKSLYPASSRTPSRKRFLEENRMPQASASPSAANIRSIPKAQQRRSQSNEDPPHEEGLEDVPEEIDSFTAELTVPPPLPKTVQDRTKKSKKGHSAQGLRSPDASHSPIMSFSKTISTSPRRPQNQYIAIPKSNPPLDLRPLDEATLLNTKMRQRQPSGPPTSPIEDISVLRAAPEKRVGKPGPAAAEPSKLYLEVQQRIAKHASTKQRDKVLKTAPIDESSIIYVSSSPSSRTSSPAPVAPESSKKAQTEQSKPVVAKRKVHRKKEKPQPMTPTEYARMLQAKAAAAAAEAAEGQMNDAEGSTSKPPMKKRKSPTVKFLSGKNIFYAGGDMRNASETTRAKMDIIVRFGGNLIPVFDPKVTTHIITDAHMGSTLKALGVKKLKDIPENIPTVTWKWVLSVLGSEGVLSQDEIDGRLNEVWQYAAFSERLDAGYQPKKTVSIASFKFKGKMKAVDPASGAQRTDSSTVVLQPQPIPASNHIQHVSNSVTLQSRHIGAPLSPPTPPECPQAAASSSKSTLDQDPHKSAQESEDPLAEFYDRARGDQKLRDEGWSSLGESDADDANDDGDETDDELPAPLGPVKREKRGWTCDKKEPQRTTDSPNQDIIDKLTELMELHKAKLGGEDHWRAFSYNKCIRALRNYPRRIKTAEEARGIGGVGKKTAQKIVEILQTGDLRRIAYEKTKDVEVTRLFQGIYGVGQSIAFQWYAAGCRTLEDLQAGKGGVKLSHVQRIGLQHYDDINSRMPRAEAREIFELIKPIALSIDHKLFVEIMGSYRRGKVDCGDIDILLTRPTDDGSTHSGVIPRLLEELHAAGILTEDLALPDEPFDLECTYRGLCRLPHVDGSRHRRIDFLSVPWTSRGAALLYYTGDDIFNRAMRYKANVLGYSLNQKGLFGNVVRDPRNRRVKFNDGVLIASETEEEIFKILGVPWQEPHERVRG